MQEAMELRKEIDSRLSYHEFKWWNDTILMYPDEVVDEYIATFDDITILVELIQNEEDIQILEKLSQLEANFFEKNERAQEDARISAFAWEHMISNSGIFRSDIPKNNKLSLSKKKELLTDFIEVVKSCEIGEISLALIVASDASKRFFDKQGIDLYLPFSPSHIENNVIEDLIKISNFNNIVKAKFIIWIFTLIAASDIKLRGLGKELWSELSVGFDEINKHYDLMTGVFEEPFLIDSVYNIPTGFGPRNSEEKDNKSSVNIEEKLDELQSLFKKKLITKEALTEMQLELLKKNL